MCFQNTSVKVCVDLMPMLFYVSASAPQKGSNTLTQFVSSCRRILWVCLIILCGWRIKGYINQCNINNINNFITLYSFEQVVVSWVWDHKVTEATAVGVLWKKVFLKIWQSWQENTCARVSFFNKAVGLKKETLPQVFSCEFCKVFKNTFLQNTSKWLFRYVMSLHFSLNVTIYKYPVLPKQTRSL